MSQLKSWLLHGLDRKQGKHMPATVYVLEGTWKKPTEAPQILPYLQAYENSHREVRVWHRTIRTLSDVEYYIASIPKGSNAFVYFACHGQVGLLDPSDEDNQLNVESVRNALGKAKESAMAFVHFGCCEFVQQEEGSRRKFLDNLSSKADGNRWVSGYTRNVDWLSSTLLDLALISEVYVPWRRKPTHVATARRRAAEFVQSYEQLARSLGFSALSNLGGGAELIPARL
jgi:hypothetical protein